MQKCGIYKISSLIDNRIYIGSSKDINARIGQHKFCLLNNKHHSIKLQRFVNKYGFDKLIFEILELCDEDYLLIKEQKYIDELKPYFNITKIAGRVQHSDEFKQQLAERNKQRIWSEESKEKISEANKGKIKTQYQIDSIIKANKGRKFTDEHKQKISEANKGKECADKTKKAVAKANSERIHSDETRKKLSEASLKRWSKINNNTN